MFNLGEQVHRLQQLKHTKVHGLPYKRLPKNPQVSHVDDTVFDIKSEQEHAFILRRFRNYSADFGRRLSKRKGQYHRPGGGYAGHTTKRR